MANIASYLVRRWRALSGASRLMGSWIGTSSSRKAMSQGVAGENSPGGIAVCNTSQGS